MSLNEHFRAVGTHDIVFKSVDGLPYGVVHVEEHGLLSSRLVRITDNLLPVQTDLGIALAVGQRGDGTQILGRERTAGDVFQFQLVGCACICPSHQEGCAE